jgi:hypothetical protein
MERLYCVVEFPSEHLVSVVPSTWIIEGDEQCKWPTAIGSRLTKLIKERALPTQAWSNYNCRVLKSYGKLIPEAVDYADQLSFP